MTTLSFSKTHFKQKFSSENPADHNGRRQVLIAGYRDKWEVEGPLPMFYRKPTNNSELREWNEPSADEYFYSLLDARNKTRCSKEEFQNLMKPKSKVYKGYLPNAYETDNAWVHAVIYMIKVTNESCLNDLNLNATQNYLHFYWKTYNYSTLRTVQDTVNTFFNRESSKKITAGSYRILRNYPFFFIAATAVASVAFGVPAAAMPLMILPLPIIITVLARILIEVYLESWVFVREDLDRCLS
ncbi:hypothetical protein M513_13974 [Trichuris suis]|uniref:Uncharacterized protein n=1 Tax=Trichuris suis TaxID=68888 RepID=A0A085LJK3_9BILA|nr:hypothetical protein M513_13974 [Trichuris suis]